MTCVTEELSRINKRLSAQGYKLTPQRDATLRVLLENEKEHLSAEEVFMLVRQQSPKIGIATVYRVLELFSELHIVEKMNFGDGVARYDLRSEEHEHMHHHLICRECGEVREIMEDWLSLLEKRLETEYGFTVTDHRLDFYGSFRDCTNNNCKHNCKAVS
ncbi:Fur family transcriptional regulator [Paenibacillus mesotrionivorans]|uniref:Fur family transcriptional regulator n=1 Tax=Paenibacillus mesotrionivorans TaxID=3160968 RepID=A0ACC7NT59_9BACL